MNMSQSPHYGHHLNSPDPSPYQMDAVSSSYQPSMHPTVDNGHSRSTSTVGADYLDWSTVNVDMASSNLDPNLMSYYAIQNHRSDLRVLGSPQREHEYAAMDGSTQNLQQPRLRRALSDDSHDGDVAGRTGGRKQRGRPRLDTKDENAADRRRTQIRLAQRAYRLRKETTISSLKERVTGLEGSVDTLKDLFLQLQAASLKCVDETYDAGHIKALKEEIHQLSHRYLYVTRQALGPTGPASEGDSPNEEEVLTPQDRSNNSSGRRRRSGGSNGDASNGHHNTESSRALAWGIGTTQRSSIQSSMQSRTSNCSARQQSTYSLTVDPPLSPPSYRSSDFRYRLQTYTFSRQLHKQSLERVYELLTIPLDNSAVQAEISRIFVYTFCYRTRDQILSSIKNVLARYDAQGTHESMCKAMSTESYAYAFDPSCPEQTAQQQRKYFGPDDVQNHLIKMGAITKPEFRNVPEGHDGGSPVSTYSELDDGASTLANSHSPTYERYDSADSGIDDGDMFTPTRSARHQTVVRVVQGTHKGIDTEVLFDSLLRRGVCLGSFPGWTREDIEISFQEAEAAGAQQYQHNFRFE